MSVDKRLLQAADLLRASLRPVVLTGAGVSKESGIPTFRDALDGLWARYDPAALATPDAFRKDPSLVWDFYEYRREIARPAQPNAGHLALADLEARFPFLPIITQNVDDLHERAGSSSVIHLHGNLFANQCSRHCQGNPTPVDLDTLNWTRADGPPACPFCGALVRPGVVWFGEVLPAGAIEAAQQCIERADLMLIVGTSGVVSPAADMPRVARRRGAKLIEVNPIRSELTPIVDVWLAGPSGEILPRLVELVERE